MHATLQTVKRNSGPEQYDLPLKIVSYKDLYGWSMDEIVKAVGTKNNCEPVPCPSLDRRPALTPFHGAASARRGGGGGVARAKAPFVACFGVKHSTAAQRCSRRTAL